jgi:quercetin dioxygenase-like cupin family protein
MLASGSYVVSPDAGDATERGNWQEEWIVDSALGGDALSMLRIRIGPGGSPPRRFPDSECALFVTAGGGSLLIGAHTFALARHDGAYIAPGEAFAFDNPHDAPLELVVTVCPQCAAPEWPAAMAADFDASWPERVVRAEQQPREASADRYYQLMVDERVGCRTITQFIGMVPRSKAPEHFHHYEETIAVLSGAGYLWTGSAKAPVGPGSLIYLPRGQRHCLECTDPAGLLLAGMFYPSGSPAVRYE